MRKLVPCFLILLIMAGCVSRPSYVKVSLRPAEDSSVGAAATGIPRLPLRVAVAAIISPQSTMRIYGNLVHYLGEKMGREAQMIQGQTYAEVNEMVRAGMVDLAFVCTGAYIIGRRDFGMELLALPQVSGQVVYYSYIIVPHDSPAQSLEDLRGKTFAFTDPLSLTGHRSVVYMLYKMGETPGHFFRRTIFTYSHDRSIKAVAEKLVDGAAVDSLVYNYLLNEEPSYREKVKVIASSPPYGIPPVVVNPRLDPQFKARLRDILLHMHEDDEGRLILRQLGIDRFVEPDERVYESAFQIVEELGEWR